MLTDKKLTFATANLFNFIEPPGAFYEFENIYERDAWQEKCRWTKNQINKLDADIVGIQEVFSIDAARAMFEQLGYPYFACVDQPNIEDGYIYSQPVVAIASRYPITHIKAVTPLDCIQQNYQTLVPAFSRKPVYTVVNVPIIGEVAVYVCHLKSQRATESHGGEHAHALIGQWLSSQQRGWEAVMLRLFMEQQYQRHPIPTVLVGDMNQPLSSDITGQLTKTINHDIEQLKLQDSWHIYSANLLNDDSVPSDNRQVIARTPTHYHFAKGNVLDYILLSQEFQTDSQYSLADISNYHVLDDHLINPIFERDKQASDHAFVAITVNFVL
ncbi:endonuclease/exonuclease/phosphatase family protein [Photobacterium nomapromontoriensis]|uniref:endonuclease/exonuclease/phosphatase family protein n=1 Tax=Photobacterium nomapromontoriensis TaxID=2910237 RepID=UPI003D0BC0B4